MHWIDTVASYLPSLIVNHLINRLVLHALVTSAHMIFDICTYLAFYVVPEESGLLSPG